MGESYYCYINRRAWPSLRREPRKQHRTRPIECRPDTGERSQVPDRHFWRRKAGLSSWEYPPAVDVSKSSQVSASTWFFLPGHHHHHHHHHQTDSSPLLLLRCGRIDCGGRVCTSLSDLWLLPFPLLGRRRTCPPPLPSPSCAPWLLLGRFGCTAHHGRGEQSGQMVGDTPGGMAQQREWRMAPLRPPRVSSGLVNTLALALTDSRPSTIPYLWPLSAPHLHTPLLASPASFPLADGRPSAPGEGLSFLANARAR
ncbi:hypothetical protein B0T24DRAFT_370113 [Lasiosphaeria ovina]|uniref:Uncharacterized protein n=1 Tax=Lasiosphaeria ovina TaxID=92902 RepID=A0AAE0N1P1_9PEZI|nr:hypothetical protein B0T24DRAFT_370113 [Lasiosphaeria ovina]